MMLANASSRARAILRESVSDKPQAEPSSLTAERTTHKNRGSLGISTLKRKFISTHQAGCFAPCVISALAFTSPPIDGDLFCITIARADACALPQMQNKL